MADPALQFAVIGDPIEHSLSPQIHTMFASQCDINLQYDRIQVPRNKFKDEVSAFFAGGGKGLNVTTPLKDLAFDYAELITDRAMNAEAVNTLTFLDEDIVLGDNTDGAGLVQDIEHNIGLPLNECRILILGAGSAVRGCIDPLCVRKPQSITILNRTMQKAADLVKQCRTCDKLEILDPASTAEQTFDLIINGTSASLSGARPDLDYRLLKDAVCYDMAYGKNAQPFIKWALAQGARSAHDGLGMLVEQAAESFRLWHGVRPETAPVLASLGSNTTRTR